MAKRSCIAVVTELIEITRLLFRLYVVLYVLPSWRSVTNCDMPPRQFSQALGEKALFLSNVSRGPRCTFLCCGIYAEHVDFGAEHKVGYKKVILFPR